MNDNRHHRSHRRQHYRRAQRCHQTETKTTIDLDTSPTSGARTCADRKFHLRATRANVSRGTSLAIVLMLVAWWPPLIQTGCREMALALALEINQPASVQTTFLGPTLILGAQSASPGARPASNLLRRPRQVTLDYPPGQVLPSPLQPPATRAPETVTLESPPTSVESKQSDWRPDMTTTMPIENFMTTSRPANGLVKRDAEELPPPPPQQQQPPAARKSLPQAHIAPTQHGTITYGPRDKRPDRKRLEELRAGDDVAKYLFKNFVPRWMDVCNRRPDRNDTIIRMYVSTWAPRSADEIEAEILAHGTHVNVTRLRKQQQQQLRRRKRAISANRLHEHLRHRQHVVQVHEQRPRQLVSATASSHPLKQQQQQVYSFQASQKSAILFKGDIGGQDKKHWLPKKTTFKLSQIKFTQHNHLSRSKNRFFTMQPDVQSVVTTESSSDKVTTTPPPVGQPKQWTDQIENMTRALFHLDTRMSWQLFGSLTTIRKLRINLEALNDTIEIDKRASREPEVGDQRREEILESLESWFPRYESLATTTGGSGLSSSLLYNITGGLYRPRLRQLYANMTEYIQFFSVAFEQMKFDQQYFYKRDWEHDERYRLVDRQLQEILCETENYLRLDREFQAQREEFLRLTEHHKLAPLSKNDSENNLKHFYDHFSNNSLRRDRPYDGQLVIESPIAKAFEGLEPDARTRILRKMDTFLPENRPAAKPMPEWLNEEDLPAPPIVRHLSRPSHLWREIMPLEQRQLYTLRERAIRDQSIIQELPPFLRSLESLLSDNYATW